MGASANVLGCLLPKTASNTINVHTNKQESQSVTNM